MTEASTPQPSRPHPPEDFHWGISYLREAFQDLRQEVRGEIQDLRQEVPGEIQQVRGEIQGVRQEIQGVRQELREEIRTVHSRIDQLGKDFSQRLDSRFSSLIIAMAAIGGLIVSLIGVVIVMIKG